jgi:non-specific serine/threonine protein kinase
MLETIREYAVEQLAASSEAERLHHQHACYFLALSKHGAASQGPDDGVWAIRLNHEYDNLRSALGWSYSLRNDSLMVLELTNALVGPWWERGLHHEMQLNLERALSYPPDTERTAIHATAHLNFANLLAFKGKYSAARTQFVHALVIWQALGDHQATAWMLNRIGWLAREQGDTATAALQLSESLAIFRSLGDTFYTAQTLNTLAGVAILQEDPACAEALLAESRALNIADPVMQGWALNHLGHAAQLRKEYSRAFQLHQESLSVFPRDYKVCLTWLYHALGETMLGLEQLLAAADWFTQGLTVSQELHDQASLAWCLAGLGSVAAHDAAPERSARLWAAAEQLRSTIGCRPAPAARASYERAVASVRAALGEQAFALAWQQGRALTLEQAIAEAFEQRVQRERGVFQQVLG